MSKFITRLELSQAYAEGKQAFEEKGRRGHNPYASTKKELSMAWWHGWDTASEESNSQLVDNIAQIGNYF